MSEYNVDNFMGAVGDTESTEDNVPVPMDEEAAGVADAADSQQASPARHCFTSTHIIPCPHVCVWLMCACSAHNCIGGGVTLPAFAHTQAAVTLTLPPVPRTQGLTHRRPARRQVSVEILTEDTPIKDPPRAPRVDLINQINQVSEVEEVEAVHSRPTRGTPDVNLPTKADALQLKAGEWGDIITVYAKPNLNSKKVHGEIMVLQQEVDASDGEGCVKVEGDPPSTRQVIKVMAKIHYDDDDIHNKVVLWGKDAVFWTKYEGDLAYIERSIKPIGAPYIGEERVFRRFGSVVSPAPFKVNELDTMCKAGFSSMAVVWDPAGIQDKRLASTLNFPGIFVTKSPGKTGPKAGDLGCVDNAAGTVSTAFHVLGTWIPINTAAFSTGNLPNMLDINASSTIGIVWRFKGDQAGGFSAKRLVIVDANVASAVYNRDPLEDVASKPRILAFQRTEPQRFISINSPEQREWLFSTEASLDASTCMRSFEMFNMLNKRARELVLTTDALRCHGPATVDDTPEGLSTLSSCMMEQAVTLRT